MWLIDRAQIKGQRALISVVSETMPHLKRGAERDFKNIMQSQRYWKDTQWNATDHVYTFETGSRIEFFSADSPDKVRGPRRDILFINEANNVSYKAFDQLAVRTSGVIWLDWNPTNEFWWYSEVAPHRDHDFITLTYKDNEALPQSIVDDIEAHRHNKNWWKVYGEGQLGEVEGKIYTNWQLLDDIPHEARLERRGLDFGYSNDPAALLAVYYWNGAYILDEELYRKGMHNRPIADHILMMQDANTLVMADAAEPKSIDEIRSYGVRILPAEKGPGSITRGIDYVQDQRIFMTKRSLNLIKEYRNYLWKTDKDGKIINVPEGGFDHLMDAARYAIESLKPKKEPAEAYFDPFYSQHRQEVF